MDIAYLLTGPTAEAIQKTAGFKVVAPLLSGAFWLELPEQWDPKSPWHDRRVRPGRQPRHRPAGGEPGGDARVLAADRQHRAAHLPVRGPRTTRRAYDPARAKKLLAEAGYPNGFDGGDFYPFPPYNSMGEAIQGYMQAVGIRTTTRSMERAAYFTAWREKKLHGVILVITAAFGNAATRLEPYATKNGIYAYGSLPEVDDLYSFARAASSIRRSARRCSRRSRRPSVRQGDRRADLRAGLHLGQSGRAWRRAGRT